LPELLDLVLAGLAVGHNAATLDVDDFSLCGVAGAVDERAGDGTGKEMLSTFSDWFYQLPDHDGHTVSPHSV
jgi:hypothetical protein